MYISYEGTRLQLSLLCSNHKDDRAGGLTVLLCSLLDYWPGLALATLPNSLRTKIALCVTSEKSMCVCCCCESGFSPLSPSPPYTLSTAVLSLPLRATLHYTQMVSIAVSCEYNTLAKLIGELIEIAIIIIMTDGQGSRTQQQTHFGSYMTVPRESKSIQTSNFGGQFYIHLQFCPFLQDAVDFRSLREVFRDAGCVRAVPPGEGVPGERE